MRLLALALALAAILWLLNASAADAANYPVWTTADGCHLTGVNQWTCSPGGAIYTTYNTDAVDTTLCVAVDLIAYGGPPPITLTAYPPSASVNITASGNYCIGVTTNTAMAITIQASSGAQLGVTISQPTAPTATPAATSTGTPYTPAATATPTATVYSAFTATPTATPTITNTPAATATATAGSATATTTPDPGSTFCLDYPGNYLQNCNFAGATTTNWLGLSTPQQNCTPGYYWASPPPWCSSEWVGYSAGGIEGVALLDPQVGDVLTLDVWSLDSGMITATLDNASTSVETMCSFATGTGVLNQYTCSYTITSANYSSGFGLALSNTAGAIYIANPILLCSGLCTGPPPTATPTGTGTPPTATPTGTPTNTPLPTAAALTATAAAVLTETAAPVLTATAAARETETAQPTATAAPWDTATAIPSSTPALSTCTTVGCGAIQPTPAGTIGPDQGPIAGIYALSVVRPANCTPLGHMPLFVPSFTMTTPYSYTMTIGATDPITTWWSLPTGPGGTDITQISPCTQIAGGATWIWTFLYDLQVVLVFILFLGYQLRRFAWGLFAR